MTVRLAKLCEVCDVNPRLPQTHGLLDDDEVSFVPIAAVSEVSGSIESASVRRFADVKKGYTSFADGDVLFAKITPCMENGKAALAHGLAGGRGFGSTEFHVLRGGESVLPEWLYYFVRRESFRREAKRTFTGTAGQQRVPAAFLENAAIPVPSLTEQRRTIDLLARANGIIRLCRDAQSKAAELIPAIFIDMFGDPATKPNSWPISKFGEIGALDRGKSRHRPRDAAALYGGPYPFIQTGDVANSGGRIRRHTATYSGFGLAQSKLWRAGTLCITIGQTSRRLAFSNSMRASQTAWSGSCRAIVCESGMSKRGLVSCSRPWKPTHHKLRRRTSISKSFAPCRSRFHRSINKTRS